MKNCSIPVPTKQKKLLKVLTCLYENNVLNQTPSTDTYFTNPTTQTYAAMEVELGAINTLINNYLTTNKIFVDVSGNPLTVEANLWSATAQGVVAYNSALDASGNTFENAVANLININDVISNVGVLKTVQKLNLDDCVNKAYQVTPVTGENNNVSEASLVERIGCPGVSNLGFLAITLQIPIANAPFNNCYIAEC